MQRLEFKIESDGENNYLIYLVDRLDVTNNNTSPANARYKVEDRLYNSFGVTTTRVLAERGHNLSKSAKRMLITEYLCSKINDVLDACWNADEYGVPIIKLSGDISSLDTKIVSKDIIIYTHSSDINKWIDEISTHYAWPNENFVFLARYMRYSDTYDVISDSLDFVTVWLTKDGSKISQLIETPEIKLVKLMHNWYSREEYDNLSRLADQAITNFVVVGKINMYIPSYLVVLSHHIKRYKKAIDTIESLYRPKFIMSLPVYRGNCTYTVLFPILEDITSDTVRR